MHTIKAGKRVNAVQLYDEIIEAVPELQPTPTGPGGRLEAQFVIEQQDDRHLLVHLPDDVDLDVSEVERVVKDHRRRPEVVVDPVADAMKIVAQRAAAGDELAQAVMTVLGQPQEGSV